MGQRVECGNEPASLWFMVAVGLASGWWNAENKRLERYDQGAQILKAENDELRHTEWRLTQERDKAVEAAKEYRFFGQP